eukprot:2898524-Amphidinium_carterae.1
MGKHVKMDCNFGGDGSCKSVNVLSPLRAPMVVDTFVRPSASSLSDYWKERVDQEITASILAECRLTHSPLA